MTSQYHPGGAQEIPETDYGWKTYEKRLEEIVVSEQDIDNIYQELRHPMAEDESIEFYLELFLTGFAAGNSALKIIVPTDSTGGFTHQGSTLSAGYITIAYGADDFNTFVGSFRGGAGGTLLGYDVHTVFGEVKAANPGLLRFQLQTTSSDLKVMPGTILRIRPMGGPS